MVRRAEMFLRAWARSPSLGVVRSKSDKVRSARWTSPMSAKALATFKSLKDIEVIEIEPAMIEASKFFDRASIKIDKFPDGVTFPADDSKSRIWYNAKEKRLYYKGVMEPDARTELMRRSEDLDYRGAIDRLSRNARHSRHSSVLEDPRVRVIPTDGKNYILATPKFYDVITAEPSNPWIAGIANLTRANFIPSSNRRSKTTAFSPSGFTTIRCRRTTSAWCFAPSPRRFPMFRCGA